LSGDQFVGTVKTTDGKGSIAFTDLMEGSQYFVYVLSLSNTKSHVQSATLCFSTKGEWFSYY